MSWFSAQADHLASASNFAEVFGNPLVILTICTLILAWAGVAAVRLRRGVELFKEALAQAYGRLEGTPAESVQFATIYEEVSGTLRSAAVLGPAWRDWAATLITPTEAGRPVRATIRPGEYFTLDLLRECRVNPRLHAAMPNLLVGVGLLLTFFGLIVALSAAGSIADPHATAAGRQNELKGLLDAASAKFGTSLTGLACSLAYTWWRAQLLQQAERALHRFLAALEERVPLATAATLQSDANDVLRASHAQLEEFNNSLAVNIGKAVDNTFNDRLGEHIGPLREAIEGLSNSFGDQNQNAIADMVRQFQEGLQRGTTAQMDKLADVLERTQVGMENVQTGLGAAAQRMSDAADQMATQMGRNAEEAMGRITVQMEGLVRQLRDLAERSREEGSQALAIAAQRIGEAGEGFRGAAERMTTQIQNAMAEMTSRMGDEARSASRQMATQLEEAVVALRSLSEQSQKVGDDATRLLTERITSASAAFEATAAKVAESMRGGAGEAAERLISAVEDLRSSFAAIAGQAGREIAGTAEAASRQQREGAEALSMAAEQAAQLLRSGGKDAADSLREGGGEASGGLRSAANDLSAPARDLAGRIVSLQEGASSLAAATERLSRDAATAGQPLLQAAERWSAIGSSAMNAANALNEATRQLAPLHDGLEGASDRLEEAGRKAAALAGQLDVALARFGGLDETMARTLNGLQTALRGFAREIEEYAIKTSGEMSKGATALASAIEELKDVLPEPAGGTLRRTK